SFTARNNLPELVAQLTSAGNKGVFEHELISVNGAPLRTHLNKGEAQQRMQAARRDYVVLQEQSTLPVKNPARTAENIRDFDTAIKEAGAQTVLYMTWARQNAPETQETLSETYTQVGRELAATVVPAGLAWQHCLATHADIVLHDKDQSHPNLAGSYLAACTFYATLFIGRSRTIPAIDIDLDDSTIKALHGTALETVRAYKKKGA
ncbi:hypothetical protein OAF45_03495, partial [Candidatus Latescibacteria bacterium]|nr:hypothetical protein [Candidatus Latescibacterota bacterium]